MRPDANKQVTGNCDCCPRINVALTPSTITVGMMQCSECYAKEQMAVSVTHTVAEARSIDAALEIKTDIFAATTVSFIELQAAINHDDSIPADMKDYALVQEAAVRYQKIRALVIETEQVQVARKNEMHALLTQTQEVASRMRSDLREKFKHLDMSYNPAPQKTPKSKPVKVATESELTKSQLNKQVREAAAKYGVDSSTVRMMLLGNNQRTPESAALELAKLMGKV